MSRHLCIRCRRHGVLNLKFCALYSAERVYTAKIMFGATSVQAACLHSSAGTLVQRTS